MKTAQILSVLLFTLALPQPAGSEPPTRFAADRPMDCLHIRLELNVDVPAKRVEGLATLRLTALRSVTSITFDAHDLDAQTVTLTGDDNTPAPADFDNDGDQIEVFLDQPLAAGDRVSIAVQYTVDDPADGLHFFGPSKNEPDVPYVVWSQGEATTNSYWFPCFDHPNERQTTELIVTTDRKYKVSSNGRLVSNTRDADTGTVTYHWLQDKPHPAYLVSMIVGEFHVERDTWRGKPITFWAHPRYKD
ncbi:MAG: DUF2808 domain-containing protein, partial [Phycisphaerae bacterium]